MEGTELTSLLCRLYTGIRVAALTAYSDLSAVRAFLKAGGVGYLMKPWDPPEERLYKPIEIILAGVTYFQDVQEIISINNYPTTVFSRFFCPGNALPSFS
jgi:DNA-binding NarL/FixJ family response regulator